MFLAPLLLSLVPAAASMPNLRTPPSSRPPPVARSIADANGVDFEYWFDQLIDHNNPSAGTFKQRYFFSDQHWKGDGSPIILQTPGEASADGWWVMLQDGLLHNKMMEALGAAGIVLERAFLRA